MDSFFPYEFSSDICKFGVGRARKVWYRVLFLPKELETDLPFDEYPRLRVDGELEDIPTSGAWIPTGDGRRYLILSPTVLREANLSIGDSAQFRFRIANQNHVDVPQDLMIEIDRRPRVRAIWDSLTAGKRRALAYHVAGAKREETVKRRIAEAIEAIAERNGTIRKARR